MSVMRGPRQFPDPDAVMSFLFPMALVLSVAAAVILTVWTDLGWYGSAPILAVPFIVAGVVSLVSSGRWQVIAVLAVLCPVFYMIGPYWFIGFLIATLGSFGSVVTACVVQKRLFRATLESLGRASCNRRSCSWGRLALFLFNVPEGVDARDPEVSRALRRTRMPYPEVIDTVILASVPCLLVCVVIMLVPGFRTATDGAATTLLTSAVYCAALALPWVSFRSLDVRVGGFGLYRGLVSTAVRLSIPLSVAVVLAALTLPVNWTLLGHLALMVVFTLLCVSVSATAYHLLMERGTARGVIADWAEAHPVRVDVSLAERTAHPLHDGVPGTPVRDADACLSDQKN